MKSKATFQDALPDSSKEAEQDENIGADKKNSDRGNGTGFKTKQCTVLYYDKIMHVLDVEFDGYGIRISDAKDFKGHVGSVVDIKYKGKIGNSDFIFKM